MRNHHVKPRIRSEEGSALLVAVVVLTLALLVLSAVAARAVSSLQAVQRAEHESAAFNAAEAGLAHAAERLRLGEQVVRFDGEVGPSTYEIHVPEFTEREDGPRFLVRATGRHRLTSVRLEALIRLTTREVVITEGGACGQPEIERTIEVTRPELLSWRRIPPGTTVDSAASREGPA